jgi:spore coat polysaccharide biosynthesis predicted glycosyltransferase SpsG
LSVPRSALFVADAAPDAGLGHLVRSSALADAVRDRGIEIESVAFEAVAVLERDGVIWEPETDVERIRALAGERPIVVLDSYRLPGEVRTRIADVAELVVLDDFNLPHPEASITVAPSDPAASSASRLTGLRYALLGRRFRDLDVREPPGSIETVLVTTGGGDPGGRAVELATAARRALPDARVQLLRGPQADFRAPSDVELIEPMESTLDALQGADLVVSGAGVTTLEACAAGVPTVIIVLAPNQAPLAEALRRARAVVQVADGSPANAEIASLAADRPKRVRLVDAGRAAVDGRGALRVAERIERLF